MGGRGYCFLSVNLSDLLLCKGGGTLMVQDILLFLIYIALFLILSFAWKLHTKALTEKTALILSSSRGKNDLPPGGINAEKEMNEGIQQIFAPHARVFCCCSSPTGPGLLPLNPQGSVWSNLTAFIPPSARNQYQCRLTRESTLSYFHPETG
jgi:hypothetical protein